MDLTEDDGDGRVHQILRETHATIDKRLWSAISHTKAFEARSFAKGSSGLSGLQFFFGRTALTLTPNVSFRVNLSTNHLRKEAKAEGFASPATFVSPESFLQVEEEEMPDISHLTNEQRDEVSTASDRYREPS